MIKLLLVAHLMINSVAHAHLWESGSGTATTSVGSDRTPLCTSLDFRKHTYVKKNGGTFGLAHQN